MTARKWAGQGSCESAAVSEHHQNKYLDLGHRRAGNQQQSTGTHKSHDSECITHACCLSQDMAHTLSDGGSWPATNQLLQAPPT